MVFAFTSQSSHTRALGWILQRTWRRFKELRMENNKMKETKYIFVTGGVVSSLGKSHAASLGTLLEQGLEGCPSKFDPYLNVDPGTMSPSSMGRLMFWMMAETDLDLGHYNDSPTLSSVASTTSPADKSTRKFWRASGRIPRENGICFPTSPT